MRIFPLVVACLVMGATFPAAAQGEASFVVTYVCDGGRYLVVGYPAYRDAARALETNRPLLSNCVAN